MVADVAVIIPAYNAAGTLRAQLDALAAQVNHPDFSVVVVDNRSTDHTAEVVAGYDRLPSLRVVPATDGAGVHVARNAGVRATSEGRILHCDADDVVAPGWVGEMARALASDQLVGGRLSLDRVNGPEVQARFTSPTEAGLPLCMGLRYPVGANIGYTRELWTQLGGFSEDFVGGHEEVDFTWRARHLGVEAAYVPGATVYYRQRSNLQDQIRQRYAYGQSFAQLYSHHQDEQIPKVSARMEAHKILHHLSDVRNLRTPDSRRRWLLHTAWTAGRLRGDLRYKVRAPG